MTIERSNKSSDTSEVMAHPLSRGFKPAKGLFGRQAGFTLVEVLIALGIVGVVENYRGTERLARRGRRSESQLQSGRARKHKIVLPVAVGPDQVLRYSPRLRQSD